MNAADEKLIATMMAKTLAMMCVRNTCLETLHAGSAPVTHAGNYSDGRVIDANGREIAWNDICHLDDGQMRDLMRKIVNRLCCRPASRRSRLCGAGSICGGTTGFGCDRTMRYC